MDHKVSKDMISSGMIPSGEKTQADLGRTQYGSAPSPSSLMEAYRSIYEHHQKDADGNVIPHEEEDVKEGKMPEGLKNYLMKKKGKKDDMKKDDMKEGMGLYANIHAKKKSGKKMRKKGDKGAPSSQDFKNAAKTAKEDADLFDLVKSKLIDEGVDEKEALKIMINLSEDELNKISEGMGAALVGGALATGMALKGLQMRNKMKNDAKKRDMNTPAGKIQSATDAKNKMLKDAGMGGY